MLTFPIPAAILTKLESVLKWVTEATISQHSESHKKHKPPLELEKIA